MYPWLSYSTLAIFCELFHLFCKSSSILPTSNLFLTLDSNLTTIIFIHFILLLPLLYLFLIFGLSFNFDHSLPSSSNTASWQSHRLCSAHSFKQFELLFEIMKAWLLLGTTFLFFFLSINPAKSLSMCKVQCEFCLLMK